MMLCMEINKNVDNKKKKVLIFLAGKTSVLNHPIIKCDIL